GDRDAHLLGHVERGEGHHVVVEHDRGRPVAAGEQGAGGAHALLPREVGLDDRRLAEAVREHGGLERRDADLRLAERGQAGDPDSDLAATLGRQPISLAMSRMRLRVLADTPGRPFNAYDTAPIETPARAAISAIVGRFTPGPRAAGWRCAGRAGRGTPPGPRS